MASGRIDRANPERAKDTDWGGTPPSVGLRTPQAAGPIQGGPMRTSARTGHARARKLRDSTLDTAENRDTRCHASRC